MTVFIILSRAVALSLSDKMEIEIQIEWNWKIVSSSEKKKKFNQFSASAVGLAWPNSICYFCLLDKWDLCHFLIQLNFAAVFFFHCNFLSFFRVWEAGKGISFNSQNISVILIDITDLMTTHAGRGRLISIAIFRFTVAGIKISKFSCFFFCKNQFFFYFY